MKLQTKYLSNLKSKCRLKEEKKTEIAAWCFSPASALWRALRHVSSYKGQPRGHCTMSTPLRHFFHWKRILRGAAPCHPYYVIFSPLEGHPKGNCTVSNPTTSYLLSTGRASWGALHHVTTLRHFFLPWKGILGGLALCHAQPHYVTSFLHW